MRKLIFICGMALITGGCVTNRASHSEIIDLARAKLSAQNRELFPDATEIQRKEWLESWWVVFENRKRDDGRWVMIDDSGALIDMGPLYAPD